MERFDTKIKKFVIFSQKKFFSYFAKWNFPAPRLKNFRRELSDLKKFLKKSTLKKILIFQEMEFSSPNLKKLLYFKRKLAKP